MERFFSRSEKMYRFDFASLQFLLLSLSAGFFLAASAIPVLPPDEVDALQVIGETLGKSWDFSVDPCSRTHGWVSTNTSIREFENIVACDCTFNDSTVCHVVNISLKAQSLPGTLPPQIAILPYLQNFDLSRNYLNGSIPPEWGNSTTLLSISLLGNRLTGTVPKELGNILTLRSLVLEMNQLSGTLPPELGRLSSLERLLLTSNNFTGELPGTFVGLTSLKDIRLGDNQFTGQIPNFIQNWTSLNKMVLQASGLTGPIPSGISLLTYVTDLRISDLTGNAAPFPPIGNMTNLDKLILRSCNITGELPDYLGNVGRKLKTLDLSFNKLQGPIPSGYDALQKVDIVFLTGNMLNGTVPDWMLQGSTDSFDISYNNFSAINNRPSSCQQQNVNVFAATAKGNSSGIVSCLGKDRCAQTSYSLRVNCGGKETTINGTKIFGDDTSDVRSSRFDESRYNWGISNTGIFMDDARSPDTYIWPNSSALSMTTNPELYTTARLSALSLTYYGYCLGNGPYTVHLHFAEIMFTNDKTYSSLGRRIFDVYIQRKLVMENFDIAREAGGVGIGVVKSFPVEITDGTLEIRFYWAGKGTNAIPVRGVYGPLISAISVDPDFEPPAQAGEGSSSMSAVVVVGIVAAVLVIILLILGILWWKGCIGKKKTMDEDLRGLDLQTGSFTLRQIRAATNNFDSAYKIGEGGFGPVYKGLLADGTIIAVKQLSSKSKQGNREFINEIGMISALQHPNLVKLYGCCIEGNQLLLIYEYLENNSLARALFGPEEHQLKLNWQTRYNICIGIARGLAYLHEESRLKIVHRDIKATNVLLDKNLEPKISDFGLAKLDEEENTHISTRIAGTFGYMAPEYAMRGYLTDKADVYSFGIVALEIVSGRSNMSYRPKEESFNLLDWALILKEKSSQLDLVDERLGSEFDKKEAMVMINLGILCTNISPAVRPLMSTVVSMLEGRVLPNETVFDHNASKEAMWSQYQREKENRTNDSENQSISLEAPWTSSSASAGDLYPIILDSAYLNREEESKFLGIS